ncbi:MAG: 6-carboxytetrahydropterin synthase [Candidatus Dadabacteria bacterium]|nr:6-carboxytetrahydropterin synthase [Candidatus Dadabacteria bacterium]
MKHTTLLTKQVTFAASHRYWNPNWTEEKNRRVFGKCTSPYGHGHNYVLEVTLQGEPHPDTGMIMNLYDLKPILMDVLADFDHKYLNEDNPRFKHTIPTTENIAKALWELIEVRIIENADCALYKVRLYETPELYVEYWRES